MNATAFPTDVPYKLYKKNSVRFHDGKKFTTPEFVCFSRKAADNLHKELNKFITAQSKLNKQKAKKK